MIFDKETEVILSANASDFCGNSHAVVGNIEHTNVPISEKAVTHLSEILRIKFPNSRFISREARPPGTMTVVSFDDSDTLFYFMVYLVSGKRVRLNFVDYETANSIRDKFIETA